MPEDRERPRLVVGPPVFARHPVEPPPELDKRDLADWLVLTRVKAGAVTRHCGRYLDGNLPFPQEPVSPLYIDVLRALNLITMRAHDNCPDLELVELTDAGRSRLDELTAKSGKADADE